MVHALVKLEDFHNILIETDIKKPDFPGRSTTLDFVVIDEEYSAVNNQLYSILLYCK
jgi:hypothetical protein